MSVKRVSLLLSAIAVVLVIAACGGDPAPTAEPAANTAVLPTNAPEATEPSAQSAYIPATVESCTATADDEGDVQTGTASYTYSEPPSRAIALNQHVTEIMLALEL